MSRTSRSSAYHIKPYSSDLVLADGTPAPPTVLYTALKDEDGEVRVCAALGLVQAGDLSAPVVDLLFAAADWRRDPEAGDRARWGIVALGKANPPIVERLLAALVEKRVALAGVAQCLGEIGRAAPAAAPAVSAALLAFVGPGGSGDMHAEASALGSLVSLGHADDAVIDRMLTLYVRGDAIVRSALLTAAGEIQPPPARIMNLLIQALNSRGSEASAAARALAQGEIDRPDIVAALVAASGASDWQLRGQAVGALGAVANPTPTVVDILYEALADRNWFVRVHALESVGRLGPEALAANPQIIKRLHLLLLGAQHVSQRGTIAITLASLGEIDAAVTGAFLDNLESTDASIRERIVRNWWLLGDGDPNLLAHLYAAQDDPEEMVRTSATASLRRLGR